MGTWPADKVERWSLDRLIPYARNARTHSDEQIAQIAGSMKEWGWTNPVLVDEEGTIIAGHGRVQAARLLGWPEAPVMVAVGWTEIQKRAYTLADNKLALNAGWDPELLRLELLELDDAGADLGLAGFDEEELARMTAAPNAGLSDPDAAPEPPADPVSRQGDVWILGRHRLVCGDSTTVEAVDKCLAGVKPHLMVTDPPYGVNYDAAWRQKAGHGSEGAAVGQVLNDDRADWREAWALFPGSVAYVWHGGLHAGLVAESLMASKFVMRAQIVWVKTRPVFSRGDYHWQHEPAIYAVKEDEPDDGWRFIPEHEVATYAVKKGRTGEWHGGRKQSTVWFIEHIKSGTGHSTQKPVECMKRPLENNSSPGQAVYEPFAGSGTTIIAAEMTGRACHAIELDPRYVDVCVRRWQDFTGEHAVLEGDGSKFEEVSHARPETETDTPEAAGR